LSATILDYCAEHAESFLAPEKLSTAKGDALVESSPIGVLFGVEPWNHPYCQIVRFAAPNLMAGNVVMVKHASNVRQCALAFERLLEEAGASAGAFTNVFISKDQVAQVNDDDRIRAVALTGSDGAGAVVAQRAGKNLKKSTMALLSSAQALETLLGQVDEAVAHGARIVMGDQRIEGQAGAFMQPTILTDIEAANPTYKQEFFGPVALQEVDPGELNGSGGQSPGWHPRVMPGQGASP